MCGPLSADEHAELIADACIQCGLCEQRCPYLLPIREQLSQATATFAQLSTE